MSKTQSGFEPLLDTAEDPAIEFFNLSNKLNRMQRVFVWNVVNNPQMSYVECARKSGYKDARQSAYKLLKHPIVKQEINYLLGEVRKKYELNQERAVKDLYDIRDQALEQGSFNAAIAAQNSLLKVGGLIVDKKEVRYGKIDQMSRAEIENRLKQLMGEVIEGEIAEETNESASTSVLNPLEESDNHDNQEVDE